MHIKRTFTLGLVMHIERLFAVFEQMDRKITRNEIENIFPGRTCT